MSHGHTTRDEEALTFERAIYRLYRRLKVRHELVKGLQKGQVNYDFYLQGMGLNVKDSECTSPISSKAGHSTQKQTSLEPPKIPPSQSVSPRSMDWPERVPPSKEPFATHPELTPSQESQICNAFMCVARVTDDKSVRSMYHGHSSNATTHSPKRDYTPGRTAGEAELCPRMKNTSQTVLEKTRLEAAVAAGRDKHRPQTPTCYYVDSPHQNHRFYSGSRRNLVSAAEVRGASKHIHAAFPKRPPRPQNGSRSQYKPASKEEKKRRHDPLHQHQQLQQHQRGGHLRKEGGDKMMHLTPLAFPAFPSVEAKSKNVTVPKSRHKAPAQQQQGHYRSVIRRPDMRQHARQGKLMTESSSVMLDSQGSADDVMSVLDIQISKKKREESYSRFLDTSSAVALAMGHYGHLLPISSSPPSTQLPSHSRSLSNLS